MANAHLFTKKDQVLFTQPLSASVQDMVQMCGWDITIPATITEVLDDNRVAVEWNDGRFPEDIRAILPIDILEYAPIPPSKQN